MPGVSELPSRVLMTGAAGAIGTCLRDGLRPLVEELVLTDVRAIEPEANERFVRADLADRDALVGASEGVDAVIHLGGVSTEVPFEQLVGPNLVGNFNVFEAARLAGVARVVFASSNHATGFYSVERTLTGNEPTRPDSLYGVTKVYGEAVGRLYVDKFDLEVVCVRIGSFAPRPRGLRELATWLSHADAIRLFVACLSAPDVGFRIVYGASANTRLFWDLTSARELGYEPQDDAERYAAELGGEPHELQGGAFTARDAGGWT